MWPTCGGIEKEGQQDFRAWRGIGLNLAMPLCCWGLFVAIADLLKDEVTRLYEMIHESQAERDKRVADTDQRQRALEDRVTKV